MKDTYENKSTKAIIHEVVGTKYSLSYRAKELLRKISHHTKLDEILSWYRKRQVLRGARLIAKYSGEITEEGAKCELIQREDVFGLPSYKRSIWTDTIKIPYMSAVQFDCTSKYSTDPTLFTVFYTTSRPDQIPKYRRNYQK